MEYEAFAFFFAVQNNYDFFFKLIDLLSLSAKGDNEEKMEQEAAQVDMEPQFQPVGKRAYLITIAPYSVPFPLFVPQYYLPFSALPGEVRVVRASSGTHTGH